MKQSCNFPLQPEEGGTFVPLSSTHLLLWGGAFAGGRFSRKHRAVDGDVHLDGRWLLRVPSGFWPIPTQFLSESAAAAGIGMINSVGNLGGFVGPMIMGSLVTRTQSFAAGMLYLVGSLFSFLCTEVSRQSGARKRCTRIFTWLQTSASLPEDLLKKSSDPFR